MPAETILVDGVDRSGVVHREDCEWAESAYLGEVGEGRVVIHDDEGTITAAGFKDVTVDTDAMTPARIMTGFVGKKAIKRGTFLANFETSREYAFTTKDGNDLLQRLKIRAAAGNRTSTSETVADTLTWLLADELSRVGVADYGRVEYPADVGVDPVDRRGQFPGDVLAALAKACRRNYYVPWNATHSGWELVFRDDNASTDDTSTISISNAGDDDGVTIFAPAMDDELAEDPEHVYSGMLAHGAKTSTYRTRAATAAAFVERDGETEDSAVKNLATLQRDADTALWESHTEEQLLPVKLHMRAAQVNLILPGQRVPTRMIHMTPEGWNPARYARVLRRKVRQPAGTDFDYEVALDLSPQEAGPPAPPAILQVAALATAPGGGTATFPNAVTVGSLLVYMGCKRHNGGSGPNPPNTDVALPRWGPGAWSDDTPALTRVEWDDPRAYREGMKVYSKVADSTSRTCYVDEYTAGVCFEISAPATMSGATFVSKDLQTFASTYAIGSLGTPSAGQIALLMLSVGAGAADPVTPLVALNPGVWVRDLHADGYAHTWASEDNSIGFNQPAPPETWIGHTTATGAALAATLTDAHSHKFAGIAVLLA